MPSEPLWVIGGAEIYRAFIPYIDDLYVSYLSGKIHIDDPFAHKDYVYFIFDNYIGFKRNHRFIPFGYEFYSRNHAENLGESKHITKHETFLSYHYIRNPEYQPLSTKEVL